MNLPPDPEGMNETRAGWADDCIAHFMGSTGAELGDALSDLLCNLMHWCDRNGLQFENELERAAKHYAQETAPSQHETADEDGGSCL